MGHSGRYSSSVVCIHNLNSNLNTKFEWVNMRHGWFCQVLLFNFNNNQICLTKEIHKLLFLKTLRAKMSCFTNGIDITWNNDKKVKPVKQLMTVIRSFLRKWHNTIIPPTGYGSTQDSILYHINVMILLSTIKHIICVSAATHRWLQESGQTMLHTLIKMLTEKKIKK